MSSPMFRIMILVSVGIASGVSANARADDAQCVVAGRLDDAGRWAPRFTNMRLLDDRGNPITAASRTALAGIRQTILSDRALLSNCGVGQLLPRLDDRAAMTPGDPVPALSAGPAPLKVADVRYTPLRSGGALVELRVNPPTDRIVMVKP